MQSCLAHRPAAFLLLLIMFVWKRKYLYIYLRGDRLPDGRAVNGIGSIFYYIGLSKLNASVAQMLYSLYPFFLVFWLMLDKQFPSRSQSSGSLLPFSRFRC